MSASDPSDDIPEVLPVEEIPEVIPVSRPARPRRHCHYCGSEDITKGLAMGAVGRVGTIGLQHMTTAQFLGLHGMHYEGLHLDLCNECGTVVRFYVLDVDRNWRHWRDE